MEAAFLSILAKYGSPATITQRTLELDDDGEVVLDAERQKVYTTSSYTTRGLFDDHIRNAEREPEFDVVINGSVWRAQFPLRDYTYLVKDAPVSWVANGTGVTHTGKVKYSVPRRTHVEVVIVE